MRDRDVAAAVEPAELEHVAQAFFEIDVGELQLRLELGAGVGGGERQRALEDAAERLRLADRHEQLAAAQIGGDRGAPELGAAERDVGRRQPQVEIDAGQAVDHERHPVPVALVVGEQADGRDIGRQIELVGGERALQGLPAVGGEGEHALGDVAVEFDVDRGERDRAAGDVGLGLEREAAEAAAGERLEAGPAQRVAQRRRVGRERAFDLQRRLRAPVAFEGELERGAGEANLQARAVAGERGGEIRQRDRAVDRLVMPDEVAGGGEALGDRRPGQRQFDIAERLGDAARRVVAARWCRR